MSKSKSTPLEVNLKNLEEAISHYRREDVMYLLKNGVLSGLTGEELAQTRRRLASLRSTEVMDFLSRQKESFTADMLQLDFGIFQNKNFAKEMLQKYSKKFDLTDEEECRKLFSLACRVDDEKMIQQLIRQKKATDCYEMIGAASMPVFRQITLITTGMIHDDRRVDLYLAACLSADHEEKLAFMQENHIDFLLKNTAGKNVVDLMEDRFRTYRYSNNKKGQLQKLQEEQTVKLLKKIQLENEQGDGKRFLSKKLIILLVVCVVAAAAIGTVAGYAHRNNSVSADSSDDLSVEEEDADSSY
ncbi:MAG: hypothetical protein LIO80_06560 [Lachnospiraceae bacterium]|nr:hypothetical protein [Lachnospiraceae bacterium]